MIRGHLSRSALFSPGRRFCARHDGHTAYRGVAVVVVAVALALSLGAVGTAGGQPAATGATADASVQPGLTCVETDDGARVENGLVRYELAATADDEYISGISRKTDGGTVTIAGPSESIGVYLFSHGERYQFAEVLNTSLRETETADGTAACVYSVTRRYEADNGRDDDITLETTTAILAGQPGTTTRIEVVNRGSDTADIRTPDTFIEEGIRVGNVELADKSEPYRFYVPGSGLYSFENTSHWETFAVDDSRPAAGVFNADFVLGFGYVNGSTPPASLMTEDGDQPRQNSDALTFDVEGVELAGGESAAWTVGSATFPMGLGLPDVSTETLGQARNLTLGRQPAAQASGSVSVTANGSTARPGGQATLSITVTNDGDTEQSPTVRLPSAPGALAVENVSVGSGEWERATSRWTVGTLGAGERASATATFDVPGRVPPGAYDVPIAVVAGNATTSTTATLIVTEPGRIAVTPPALRFGNLTIGDERSRTVTVRNDGSGVLSITDVSLTGTDSGAFSVSSLGDATIDPGERRDLTVTIAPESTGSKSAMLQIASDDPRRPLVDVWLTNTRTIVEMDRSRTDNQSSVNVSMRNVGRDTTHSLSVGGGDDADEPDQQGPADPDGAETGPAASLTQVNFTTSQNVSDMTMNVTQSDRPMESTPTTNLSNGTEPLNFFRIDHSVSNDAFSSVNVTVEVARSRVAAMADTDPNEVALYREGPDGWAEVPTVLVRNTSTHHVYRGSADGFSEWATGAKQPQFRITRAQVNVSTIRTGSSVLVRVRITNEGGADGQFNTDLLVNDDAVASREVSIASGGTRQVTFDQAFQESGQYEVRVNDRFAGRVNVSGPESGDDATGDGAGAGSLPLIPLAAGAVVLVVAVVGGLLYRRS